MNKNWIFAACLSALCALPVVPAMAGQDTATYLHRSRGSDLRAVELKVKRDRDGSAQYVIDDFPSGREGSSVLLAVDAGGKPVAYRSASNGKSGYEMKMVIAPDLVSLIRKMPDQPAEEFTCPVRAGSLPDFNSRPDPYLSQHLLIKAYDFAGKGKQVFSVYDIDDTGKGLSEYEVSLELVDEDGVVLPNGKFKARHLVQVQQSSAPTWYKKHRGSQTDFWVNDDGDILRVYRHREPYELILQDYDNRKDLISKTETAQGYPQPVVKAP